VFRRRKPRGWPEILRESVAPRRGWKRSVLYVVHRLRRLPDPPHRVARGVFSGILVSFTPLFGVHLVVGAALAWAIRGNVLAALLATFVGNPLTFPLIAAMAIEIGYRMLDIDGGMSVRHVLAAFSGAWLDLWDNLRALFTAAPTNWNRLHDFFRSVFLPYLVGGLGPGIVAGLTGYWLTLPIVTAYHQRRERRRIARHEKAVAARQKAGDNSAPPENSPEEPS
jgi:uncharacterized protein (DUF2062 family)